MPSEVEVKNGHGLALDSAGNIYYAFEPENVEAGTKSLARFTPSGQNVELIGSPVRSFPPPQPPSGGRIPSRSPYSRHAILIRRGESCG
jgi:hypothetical protein